MSLDELVRTIRKLSKINYKKWRRHENSLFYHPISITNKITGFATKIGKYDYYLYKEQGYDWVPSYDVCNQEETTELRPNERDIKFGLKIHSLNYISSHIVNYSIKEADQNNKKALEVIRELYYHLDEKHPEIKQEVNISP